jgi:hypothetical protein
MTFRTSNFSLFVEQNSGIFSSLKQQLLHFLQGSSLIK